MSYYVKDELPCIDCGEPTKKRQPKSHAPLCLNCGIGRVARNIMTQAKAGGKNLARDQRAVRKLRKSG